MIEGTIKKHLGIKMNPHLIRSLIATVLLDDDPRNVTVAQRALDHKTHETTMRPYAMQRGRATNAEYTAIMQRRIRRLSK